MSSDDRLRRLQKLSEVPKFAAADHRFFLDESGQDKRLAGLSRVERRQLKRETTRIAESYRKILQRLGKSGAGFAVDRLLRQLALEYTNRYASSGLYNQPLSFNYFESFCDIRLIENSYAPYAWPVVEVDHLFSVVDYLDYATDPEGAGFHLSELKSLPEGKAFHYTPNGSISDFTFLSADGREFLIGGFSMIRHGNSLHWYVIGGETYSKAEWDDLSSGQPVLNPEDIPAYKRRFLTSVMKREGNESGPPVPLEGTETALRTVIAAETDLDTQKHVARLHMQERKRSFSAISDDPDLFRHVKDPEQRLKWAQGIQEQVQSAEVMWSLGEAMFQLPAYFNFKVAVAQSIPVTDGRKLAAVPKGGQGVGVRFRYVSALDFRDQELQTIRPYKTPHYKIETEGYWRYLKPDEFGEGRRGNRVRGRTWIKEVNDWRQRSHSPRTIYVKSAVSAARIRLNEYLARAESAHSTALCREPGVLYVLRCTVMQDEVYKVGWTSGTAEERASELSTATGVPTSFVVVGVWKHADPSALESNVHAMLAPYRVAANREFFQVEYATLKRIVELEISRSGGGG